MNTLWNVEDQRYPFEVPGSKRQITDHKTGKKWTECDYTAHLVFMGQVEASSSREAMQRAKELGLSSHPIVWPQLGNDELLARLQHLVEDNIEGTIQ